MHTYIPVMLLMALYSCFKQKEYVCMAISSHMFSLYYKSIINQLTLTMQTFLKQFLEMDNLTIIDLRIFILIHREDFGIQK